MFNQNYVSVDVARCNCSRNNNCGGALQLGEPLALSHIGRGGGQGLIVVRATQLHVICRRTSTCLLQLLGDISLIQTDFAPLLNMGENIGEKAVYEAKADAGACSPRQLQTLVS